MFKLKLFKVNFLKAFTISKSLKLFLLLTLPFLMQLSCNTIEPTDDLQPGRRDYVWTVDTVKVPFNYLSRISGSSPKDLWAVGSGGGLDETIWHYDGIEWKTDKISRGIIPTSVFSFSRDNVWISGYEGKIWCYNGIDWKQSLDFKLPNYSVSLVDIWGESPQNIYSVGCADSGNFRKAFLLKYDGNTWREMKIPYFNYCFIRIKKDIEGTGKYYLLGNDLANNTSIFEYDGGNNINKIYEAPVSLETAAMVQNINSKTFFTIGKTISIYLNNQFKMIFRINDPNFGFQFFGRSEKDILLRMFDGIAHYNGSNIEYLYRFINNDRIDISDAIIFKEEVFFLTDDFNNNQNLFFRGTLK